ncbi:hypothetical protein [Immundisolibacter sp.]
MSYKLTNIGVIRVADSLHITRDKPEWGEYRAWLRAGNVPLPMDVVPPPTITLPEAKKRKIKALTNEALARLPEFVSIGSLILMRELYQSIAAAARQPTAKLTSVINIYLAWETAVDQVKACSTIQCVAGVTVSWP